MTVIGGTDAMAGAKATHVLSLFWHSETHITPLQSLPGNPKVKMKEGASLIILGALLAVAVLVHSIEKDEDAEGSGCHDAYHHARGTAGLPEHLYSTGRASLRGCWVGCGHMVEIGRIGYSRDVPVPPTLLGVMGGGHGWQQHLVAVVHFASRDATTAAAATRLVPGQLVRVSSGGGGGWGAMGIGGPGEMAVTGVLNPALHCRGRWQDRPIGYMGGIFVIVLIIRLVLLVQGAGGAAVGQCQGFFGGFKQGEEGAAQFFVLDWFDPTAALTCVTLSLMVGERCLRVVVVAMVVVVSMIVVDMSARGVVEVVSVVRTDGTSPTSLRFPSTCTLGSPSAASFSTCSPL
ncbi:hypothetical protein JZ751_006985 [Albula glossodonta]|uniref:Uncharacterized protein n=1 Tax=Albula glossodonta TaxID=121402 RepID=A0A8T2NZX3_9TELE|nr:hypothetical protein JZ751_006985 [Albula glossodonta]